MEGGIAPGGSAGALLVVAGAAAALSAAGCRGLLPLFVALAIRGGAVKANYRGEPVPVGMGAAAVVPALTIIALLSALGVFPPRAGLAVSFGAGAMLWVGGLDDAWGDRSVTGLRGHLTAARRGRWTTGAFKAVVGVLAGFIASLLLAPPPWSFPGSLIRVLVGTGLMATAANTANLLDVRPGRAVKFLVLFWTVAGAAALGKTLPATLLAAVNLGVLIVYGPWDMGGRVMMGDAGANALGMMLGIGLAAALPPAAQAFILALFVALHWLSERRSLTEVIEQVPLLKRLDEWGRKPPAAAASPDPDS